MILFTSVCNDLYLPGMLVFLYSLKKHNPNFNYPFKIYHKEDLSDSSKESMFKVFNNLIFENITDDVFLGEYAHYMCLLPFKEEKMDRVIFIDCDVLCLDNIEGLLHIKKNFGACLDIDFRFPKNNHIVYVPYLLRPLLYFNTGVFSVSGKYLTRSFFQHLRSKIEANLVARERRINPKKLWDQDIINEALRFADVEVLPFTYNAIKNLYKKGQCPIKEGAKIIHYTGGAKPWYTKKTSFLPLHGKYSRYKNLHRIWHDYRQSFIEELGFDPMEQVL